MGFTRGNPWRRAATGFYSNRHPPSCCHLLGYENFELVALFNGTQADEKAVKMVFPPTHGEFWPDSLEAPLVNIMSYMCVSKALPLKPAIPPLVRRKVEKLPCCAGLTYTCSKCSKSFNREHHLWQHLESHNGKKVSCTKCGSLVLKRNLKRHHNRCKQ